MSNPDLRLLQQRVRLLERQHAAMRSSYRRLTTDARKALDAKRYDECRAILCQLNAAGDFAAITAEESNNA